MAEAKKPADIAFVIESRAKEYIKSKGMHSSGDLASAVSTVVAEVLDKAVARCKANGRTTVSPKDL